MQAHLAFPVEWPRGIPVFLITFRRLAAVDIIFIAIFLTLSALVAGGIIAVMPWRWDITIDVGLPERFNHLKWLLASVVLGICAVRTRAPLFAFMAALFAVFLVDDTIGLHERFGPAVAEAFGIPAALGLRARDFGELMIFAAAGAVIGTVGLAAVMASDRRYLVFARRYAVVLAGLAACGVVFDALHAMFAFAVPGSIAASAGVVASTLEDGGEMIFTSLAAAYSVGAMRAL